MRAAMTIFVVVVLFASWGLGILAYSFQESLGQFAGMLFLPVLVAPFVMAYISHRISGAIGNPFKGLVWGHTSWYFLIWVVGLIAGSFVVLIALVLGAIAWDPTMSAFVQASVEQAESQGQDIPSQARGFIRVTGYIMAFGAPSLGPWFGAAVGCLGTFGWLGWFGRRLLVRGRATAIWTLLILWALSGMAGGFLENPQFGDASLVFRLIATGALSAALTPAVLWLFFITRSAVLPALAQASFQAGMAALVPFQKSLNDMLAPPVGLLVPIVALCLGIALWIIKDPGGKELAIAAVAYDGTPLTPAQVKALEEDADIHQVAAGDLSETAPKD